MNVTACLIGLWIALFPPSAFASRLVVLDTLSGVSETASSFSNHVFGSPASVRGIALPFSVPTDGRIVSIETGLELFRAFPCEGVDLSIVADSPFLGTPILFSPQVPTVLHTQSFASIGSVPGYDCLFRDPVVGAIVGLSAINWELAAGSYWLVALPNYDMIETRWKLNDGLLSADWSASGGRCCGGEFNPRWETLAQQGLSASAMPTARIVFEVPEPTALSLLASLILLVVHKRRELRPSRRQAPRANRSR